MSNNTILAALRRMGYTKDEMTGHGFRIMAERLLYEQEWPAHIIELQLGRGRKTPATSPVITPSTFPKDSK
jgi:hypothetical protein